jgi:triacylglycerol lipase
MSRPRSFASGLSALFAVLALATAGCVADADAGTGSASSELAGAGEGPYPIVIVHGFFGFDKFAGIETLTYFYGVKDYLKEHGEKNVYTPAVDPFNDSQHRAARLLEHIERVRRETGASKVNLIGHSQGGLDARVVAHDHPELVASVTTIGTPHHGTPFADILDFSFPGSGLVHAVVDELIRVTLKPLWEEITDVTSFERQIRQLSSDGMRAFNAQYPDTAGIPYFSIAGRSDDSLGGDDCKTDSSPPFITKYARARDGMQPLLSATEFILDGVLDGPFPNDGIVRVRDAKWGTFLGCVPADHFDEVGQILEEANPDGRHWNHKELYAELVKFLRQRGL